MINNNLVLQGTFIFFVAIYRAILRRCYPELNRLESIPTEVGKIRASIISQNTNPIYEVSKYIFKPKYLTITKTTFYLSHEDDWRHEFSDPEITSSMHRWNWLLRSVTDDAQPMMFEDGIDLVRSWLVHAENNPDLFNDPYSSAERLTNLYLFAFSYKVRKIPEDLIPAIKLMAEKITIHLEYHEKNRTGNHAFNNARGLFFAGIVTTSQNYLDLSYAVMEERLKVLVTEDGFLREGSSHYHFLFTRWVLEIFWISSLNNFNIFKLLLKPFAEKLVKRCWFFLVYNIQKQDWSIPLIGDISPDFPPSWLLDIPWSYPALEVYRPAKLPSLNINSGWGSLFGVHIGEESVYAPGDEVYESSGWLKIVKGRYILYSHSSKDTAVTIATHGHIDLCSFELYLDGNHFISDSGRIDYTLSNLSIYGRSAQGHNTILINGISPSCDARCWMHPSYSKVKIEYEYSVNKDFTVIKLYHSGFSRIISDQISHARVFLLSEDGLKVIDELEGKHTHNFMLRFNSLNSYFRSDKNSSTWICDSMGEKIITDERFNVVNIVGEKKNNIGGVFSENYGQLVFGTTLELNARLSLPATILNNFTQRNLCAE